MKPIAHVCTALLLALLCAAPLHAQTPEQVQEFLALFPEMQAGFTDWSIILRTNKNDTIPENIWNIMYSNYRQKHLPACSHITEDSIFWNNENKVIDSCFEKKISNSDSHNPKPQSTSLWALGKHLYPNGSFLVLVQKGWWSDSILPVFVLQFYSPIGKLTSELLAFADLCHTKNDGDTYCYISPDFEKIERRTKHIYSNHCHSNDDKSIRISGILRSSPSLRSHIAFSEILLESKKEIFSVFKVDRCPLKRDTLIVNNFTEHYVNTQTGEEILLLESYDSNYPNQQSRLNIAHKFKYIQPSKEFQIFQPGEWGELAVLSMDRISRTVIVQFPSSQVQYTLRLSPDNKTLTCQGNDGSAPQHYVATGELK